eukprot:g1078.t1
MRCSLGNVVVLGLVSSAAAAGGPIMIMEPDVVPAAASAEWSLVGRATAADTLALTVVMRRDAARLAELERRFWAVSTPGSADYGRHLSQNDVTALVAPADSALERTLRWLRAGGAEGIDVSAHRDLVRLRISAPRAEALFNTELRVFRTGAGAGASATAVRATRPYALPAEVAAHVSLVDGLLRLPYTPPPPPPRTLPGDGPDADEDTGAGVSADWPTDCSVKSPVIGGKYVTPAVLAQAYSMPAAKPTVAKGKIAVAEFQGEFWDQADLDNFGAACGLGANLTVDEQIGDNNPKKCSIPIIISPPQCKETLLDILTIKGLVGAIPLTDVYTKDYDVLGWAKQLGDMPDGVLPQVQSVSYGRDESQETGDAYIQSVNVEFQKLGARGVSVLFASGDMGVSGRSGSSKRFHAGFPCSSPYVTCVGGTNFATKNVVGAETAWSGSGGGFSDHFGIPSYQAEAVAGYLAVADPTANSTFPPRSAYNQSGRGFPDVSALGGAGNQYLIYQNKKATGAYGTSAATPVVAAVAARLNELRLAAGRPPLGFLNPLFYQNAAAFNDVTSGINCGLPAGCSHQAKGRAFPAVVGWDPVTGLGTPNYAALAKIVAQA